PDGAGVGGERGGHDAQQRRLAGPVRAEQPGHPGLDVHADPVQGAGGAELLADVDELDGGDHDALPVSKADRRATVTSTAATARPASRICPAGRKATNCPSSSPAGVWRGPRTASAAAVSQAARASRL